METLILPPNQESYSVTQNGGAVRAISGGVQGIYRRTFLNNARKVTCKWGPLSETEFQYLRTFYLDHKALGFPPFLVALYFDDQAPELREACFVTGTFSYSAQGLSFTVSIELEVTPEDYDTANTTLPQWWDCAANAPNGWGGGGGEPTGPAIGWYSPIATSPIFGGTVAHTNSGAAPTSFHENSVSDNLYAGLVGWAGETVVWSIVSWTSVDGHPSPTIVESVDGWVHLNWANSYGGELPVLDASIGTLILSATVNGTPIPVGQRLIAVTTPPVLFYPDIAWGPE